MGTMDGYWIGADTGKGQVVVRHCVADLKPDQTQELDRIDALAVLLAASDNLLRSCQKSDILSISQRLHLHGGLSPRSVENLHKILEPYE